MNKLGTLARFFDQRALYCQLIVTRRCNLSCGYCNEFDKVSQPVPYEVLTQRIDHLTGELGVTIMDFLGGEPLLHPRLVDLVAYAKERGCWTNIITNGLLLSEARIRELNAAGLDSMCVSIDRIHPNDFTRKGLKPLRRRLRVLRQTARFSLETNTVICEETLDEIEALVTELKALGYPVRCSIRHYEGRQVLNDTLRAKLRWFNRNYRHWRIAPMLDLYRRRQDNQPASWKCTGGYKFLYVDEFGTVKPCSQVSLSSPVNVLDLKAGQLKQNDTHKACEHDCGVSCVIQTSLITQKPVRYFARCAQHVVLSSLQSRVTAWTSATLSAAGDNSDEHKSDE